MARWTRMTILALVSVVGLGLLVHGALIGNLFVLVIGALVALGASKQLKTVRETRPAPRVQLNDEAPL